MFRPKATEGAKNLEDTPEEPPGAQGAERTTSGGDGNWRDPPRPVGCDSRTAGASRSYNRKTGSGARAGKESEAAVVPLEPDRQQNDGRWEGPLLHQRVSEHGWDGECRKAMTAKYKTTQELQRTLYRAVKADPERRFHGLHDKVHRRTAWSERGASCPTESSMPRGRAAGPRDDRMPPVNGVGKPDAGEPHVRFDVAAGASDASLICAKRAGRPGRGRTWASRFAGEDTGPPADPTPRIEPLSRSDCWVRLRRRLRRPNRPDPGRSQASP